jgi:hypothetical protein
MANLRRNVAEFFRAHPSLWQMINPPYRRAVEAINEWRVSRAYRDVMLYDARLGNLRVKQLILAGKAAAIGKIGSLEAEAVEYFLAGAAYPEILRKQMFINVGLHPADRTHLDAFCEAYLRAADRLDLLAAWGNRGERAIINRVGPRPLVRLAAFESWLYDEPWSAALAGKKVVLVTPFARSAEAQFARRSEIWLDPAVLPELDLRVVKMPLSPGLVPPTQKNWQERYQLLADQIESAPYDVLLVGAGGLSILLAAHAKARGKIGFHLGGHTQILFGITGRRWDKDHELARRQGPTWVRPAGDEAPPTVTQVEQGCYW